MHFLLIKLLIKHGTWSALPHHSLRSAAAEGAIPDPLATSEEADRSSAASGMSSTGGVSGSWVAITRGSLRMSATAAAALLSLASFLLAPIKDSPVLNAWKTEKS